MMNIRTLLIATSAFVMSHKAYAASELHEIEDIQLNRSIFSRLQLHQNNEFYDSNNSDNSFEFEIIMVKNKDLLK